MCIRDSILGEIIGYALNGDAHHITATAPEGEGAARCINMALNNAGINKEDVDYINAHGTSTVADATETQAIKTVFNDHAKKLAISSTKSMIGHALGASGALEAVACVKAINDGIATPTINYENQDPECSLNYVPNKSEELTINAAMSNSFGFGGHNAVIVFKKWDKS